MAVEVDDPECRLPLVVDPIGDSAQSLDTQAVDSGFSSSSPADRQSPSPKVRFGCQSESEDSRPEAQPMHARERPIAMESSEGKEHTREEQAFAYTQPLLGSVLSISDSAQPLPTSNSPPQSCTTSAGQAEAVDCALDLSANSTSFPRLPDGKPGATSYEAGQPSSGSVLSACTSTEAASVESILSTLKTQVTGLALESKLKVGQEQDAAHLIKHNKIAEPPNCGCVNRPCKQASSLNC